jgi:Global regulator protein family
MSRRQTTARRIRPARPGLTLAVDDGEEVQLLLPGFEPIVITALRTARGRARLHFAAPAEVKILRGKLVATAPAA